MHKLDMDRLSMILYFVAGILFYVSAGIGLFSGKGSAVFTNFMFGTAFTLFGITRLLNRKNN